MRYRCSCSRTTPRSPKARMLTSHAISRSRSRWSDGRATSARVVAMAESDPATLKRAAATRALDFVQDGMKLGLGTGSTAEAFLEVLAPRVRGGLDITGAASSERTAIKARSLGIPVAPLEQLMPLDLTV